LLGGLDGLPIHIRPATLDLNKHGAKAALPDIAEHTFGRQRQFNLRVFSSAHEDFGK
jgi:hypothetical protein